MKSKLFFFLSTVFLLTSNYAFANAPSVSVWWSPSTITLGESTRINHSSSNATSCVGTKGGSVPLQKTGPLMQQTASKTVTITCTGPGGSTSRSASLTVLPPPPPKPSTPGAPSISKSSVYTGEQYSVSFANDSNTNNYRLYQKVGSGAWKSIYWGPHKTVYPTQNHVSTFYYKLERCNAGGCSAHSSSSSVRVISRPPPVPDVPGRPSAPATAYKNTNYSVSWGAVSGATSYKLYRNGGSILNGSSRSKTENRNSTGSNSYTVEACNSGGCSDPSPASVVSVVLKPLGTAGLTSPAAGALLDNGIPCFDWTSAAEASHYTVQVSSDTNFNESSKRWVKADLTNTNQCWNSTFDANPTAGSSPNSLEAGQTFYWRIKSMDGLTSSGPRATFTGHRAFTVKFQAPEQPTGSAREEVHARFTVDWSEVTGATRYELYENGTLKNSDAGLSEEVYGPTAGSYDYQVKACNDSICSDLSTALSVDIYKVGTATPLLPAVNEITSGVPCFSWEAAQDADYYNLQLGKDPSVANPAQPRWVAQDITGTSVCWNDTFVPNATAGTTPAELEPGETYYWRVKSRATFESSRTQQWSFSTPRAITIELPQLDVPESVSGPAVTGEQLAFDITWNEVANATRYEVLENGELVAEVLATAELKYQAVKATAGEYRYTVKACTSVCGESSTEHLVTVEARRVIGNIGGITEHSDHYTVFGWTCEVYNDQPIEVEFYAGGQKGQGDFIVGGLTHASSEAAISTLCANQGTLHRFSLRLPEDKILAHAGKTLYGHGVFADGTAGGLIGLSNTHKLPEVETTPEVPYDGNTIDFNEVTISSFVADQDLAGTTEILDGGATIRLVGNQWKQIPLNYTITPNTVLEFEFSSNVAGEVHGIGLSAQNYTDGVAALENSFQLLGEQACPSCIRHFKDYKTSELKKSYRIPLGQFYSGSYNHLFFVMDEDRADRTNAESVFSNVRISESSSTPRVLTFDDKHPDASRVGHWWTGTPNDWAWENQYQVGSSSVSRAYFNLKSLPEARLYEVAVWHAGTSSTRKTDVKIEIQDENGTSEYIVNQQQFGSTWNTLGVHFFTPNGNGLVTVYGQNGSGAVSADAVRLIPLPVAASFDVEGVSQGNTVTTNDTVRLVSDIITENDVSVERVEFSIDGDNWVNGILSGGQYSIEFSSLPVGLLNAEMRVVTNRGTFKDNSDFVVLDASDTPTYHFVNPTWVGNNVDIVAMANGSIVEVEGSTIELNKGDSASHNIVAQGAKLTTNKPVSIGTNADGLDLPIPSTYAGTAFVVPLVRYTPYLYFYSPDVETQVTVKYGTTTNQFTVSAGQVRRISTTSGEGDAAIVTSEHPILLTHTNASSGDAYPVPPASNVLYGIKSTAAYVAAIEDGTVVKVSVSGVSKTTINLSAGQAAIVNIGSDTGKGQGSAIKLSADKPIAAIQIADTDGSESTAFLPYHYFAKYYTLPVETEYVAVVCTSSTAITLVDPSGTNLSEKVCTGSDDVSKAYFSESELGQPIPAGSEVIADEPVYLIYETKLNTDEHNLLGHSREQAILDILFAGQNESGDVSVFENLVVSATPAIGREAEILTVEFSIDGTDWFAAELVEGVYQYDFGLQDVGELTLSVRINGSEEISLTTIFNVVANLPEPQLESPEAPVLASIGSYDVESAEVGTLPGQFRVDESGAATYNVPLTVPEGVAGVTPQLSLGYNSSGGNGPLGIGWGINGANSMISRCRHTLEQDGEDKAITLTNTDRLCLDGQKLIAVNGIYGENGTEYRTEINNRSRITGYMDSASNTSYFTVEKEDGSISYYGAQDIAKNRSDSILLSGDVPLNWYLTSTSDNFRLARNTIFFNYNGDNPGYGENEILIDNIQYSDNYIDFVYTTNGARVDRTSRHYLGAQVEMKVKLSWIRILNHSGDRVGSYHLTYETDAETKFNRIKTLTSCGVDASTCLPATTFDWHNQNPLTVESFSTTASLGNDNIRQVFPADIDGDGFTDLIHVSHLGHKNYAVNVSYNDKSGTFKAPIGVFTFSHEESEDYPVLVRPVDIDGDGLVEILHYAGQTETGALWKYFDFNDTSIRDVYNCSGYGEDCSVSQYETHIVSLGLAASTTSKDVSFHDVNADAYPDLVYFKEGKNYIKLNNRMGGFESHTHEADINVPSQSNPNGLGNVTSTVESMEQLPASDFNGDGRADFVFVIEDSYESLVDGQAPIRQSYWMAFELAETDTGGYQYESVGEIFETRYSAADIDNHFLYAGDLDSDGRTDIVKLEKDSFKAYYSLSRTTGMTPAGFTGMSANQQNALGFQIIDADKDGRADIVYFDSGLKRWTVQYHTFGGGFTAAAALTGITDDNHEQGNEQLFLADWNGNGELGVGRVNFGSKELYYRQDNEAVNLPAHRIKTITNGFGIATEINYGLMTDPAVYTKGSGADSMHFGRCRYDGTNAGDLPTACTPIFDLISPGYLVQSVTSDAPSFDNPSATLTVNYHYEGMRAQAGGRGMLGFEKIRTFDQQTGVSTETLYHQNFPFIGMPKETRKFIGTQLDWASVAENKKLSYASNQYSYATLDNGKTIYPYLATATDTQYSLNDAGLATSKISSVVTDNTYVVDADNHLNLEQVVVTTKNGTGGIESEVTTNNTYVDDVSNWWLGRVTATTVTHSIDEQSLADDITRSSSFEYYALSDPRKGMLKREIVEPLGSVDQRLTTLHCYSGVGNKTQTVTYANVDNVSCTTRTVDTTDDPGKVFRFAGVAYDADFRYTTHTKDALFEPRTVNARNALGQVTQSTDINGVVTKVGYDAFGRQFASSNSLGGYSETQRRLRQHAWSGTPSILDDYYFVERQTGNATPTSYAYFDVMGRQVAAVKQGFKASEWIHQYSRYDRYGRAVEQSVVKKTSTTAAVSPAWNKTNYDVFGRPQTIESADGTDSNIAYNGLTTTTSVTFDTVNGGFTTQNSTEVKNVLGQAESVTDSANGTVNYAYDATGNLTSVIGVDNVIIETTFDKLGRKVAMKDPNKGNWTYKYNALGELVEQTSSRAHKTQFYRDSLGRTTKRVVSGGDLTENEETRYSFNGHLPAGTCFWKGNSCEADKPNTSYAYDDFGRPITVITKLDGEPYVQQTTYDQFGRVFQQYDATGDFFGIRHHYNAQGYAYKQVEARYSAANDAKVYYEVKDMDAFGNVIHFEQNDGKVTTHKAFDANTGFATGIQANNGFLFQDNVYQFDGIGNLRSRSRMALDAGYTHRKETFAYDNLNRLTNASGISHSVDVSYYANGNIKYKSDLNNAAGNYYCYRTDMPHAVSGLGAQGCSNDDYQYDASGNMTEGRGRNITYAHFDKPTRISNSAGVTSFAYDAKRSRYKRETTEDGVATKTYYIGNVEMVYKDGQYAEARRYLPQAIQTQYKSGAIKTRYLHKDHLGSIDSITDDDGKLVEKLYFDAWGKRSAIPLHAWDNINEAFRAMTVADVLDITTVTPRGFTGHEHVEHADIIHMNGRIYDPSLGRFLQADPFIQAPKNSQSYNRYSYIMNNPLSGTDPTGYIGNFFRKVVGVLTNGIVGEWLASKFPIVRTLLQAAHCFYGNAIGCAASSFGNTIASGGSLKAAFTSAAFAYASAEIFSGIGDAFNGTALQGGLLHIGSHAVAGGVLSTLQGGKFGHGFWSAGLTKAININGIFTKAGAGWNAIRTVTAAVVGGTISKITGGKFANGATTAAFAQHFNGNSAITEDGCQSCYPFGKESQETMESTVTDELAMIEGEAWDQVVKNRLNGKAAEQAAADEYIRKYPGSAVKVGGVTLSVDGSIRYPDLTIMKSDGTFEFVEVKSGAARLVKRQIRLDRIIQTKGAIVTRSDAGFIPLGAIPPTNVDLFRVALVPKL